MCDKFNYCLFKRCDILVSKYPESFVKIENVVRKKIKFITVKGYETPTANEYENLCRYEMQQQLMILASTLILALIPLASSQGSGDSAHSCPFPNPRTSHGNYSIVLCDNVDIKRNKYAFKVSV